MAERRTHDIEIVPKTDIDDFISELKGRKAIRLVKVSDEGIVEPARQGGAVVMQPRFLALIGDTRVGSTVVGETLERALSDAVSGAIGRNRVSEHAAP